MMKKKSVQKKGVALLLVMMSMALLVVLLVEILFASRVDLRIGGNSRNRLQAFYLAQSAARFAILRLHFYRLIHNMKNSSTLSLPINQSMLDSIWSQTLPMLPLETQKVTWPGQFSSSITSEGSKIPINLLDGNIHRSSSKEIQDDVYNQVLNLIKGHLEDEELAKQYRDLVPEELVNNLRDWIDTDNNKVGGGDESADYDRFEPRYSPRNDRIPVLSELQMIKGWSDDWVKRLSSDFSVLNNRLEVNPNFISLSRLKAIHPLLSQEDLMAIQKRRLENPFTSLQDLEEFVTTDSSVRNGRNFSMKNFKQATTERIFYIEAVGIVGESRRTLKLGVMFRQSSSSSSSSPSSGSQSGGSSGQTSGQQSSSSSSPASDKSNLNEPMTVSVEEVL